MMETNLLKQLVYTAVESNDSRELVNTFVVAELGEEHFEFIFKELGELLTSSASDSPENVPSVLQVLSEVITSLNTENKSVYLDFAKYVLQVITDEHCSIINMKKALHFFNDLIQYPGVIEGLRRNPHLEGSMQIFGRKVSSVGDFACQALFIENMWQIANNENCKYWINVWFTDPSARSKFINLNDENFEESCRQLLNHINRNEPERRVFSVLANTVTFGSFQLKSPKQCDMWIDFNYDSQSISFFCSEISLNVSPQTPRMWETVHIDSPSVKYFSVIERKAEQKNEVVLLLNCPCRDLTTSSFRGQDFNSYEVRILFWNLTDIYSHLEIIYGKDKYIDEFLEEITKASIAADAIQIVNEVPGGALLNQPSSQRKASNSSYSIAIDACENEVFIPDTVQNQNFSVFRKISQSVETINFMTEVSSEDLRNLGGRKISASSGHIQVNECERPKTRMRSSVSMDALFFQSNNAAFKSSNLSRKSLKKFKENPSSYRKRKVSHSSIDFIIESEDEQAMPKQIRKRKKKTTGVEKIQCETLSDSPVDSVNVADGMFSDGKLEKIEMKEAAANTSNKNVNKFDESKLSHPKVHSEDLQLALSGIISKYFKEKESVVDDTTFNRSKSEFISNNKKFNKADKETENSIQFPSLIDESFIQETVFKNDIPITDTNEDGSYRSSAVMQPTLKCKEKLMKEEYSNQVVVNEPIASSKEIEKERESRVPERGSNLTLRETEIQMENKGTGKKLSSSFNCVESQKTGSEKEKKRSSSSSKETDNGEVNSKSHHRRVRLYNLESAPLYDVPPGNNINDPASDGYISSRSNLLVTDKADVSENTVNTSDLKDKQKVKSDDPKLLTSQKRTKSSELIEPAAKEQQISLHYDFPRDDEDFQELSYRDSDKRKRRKSSETTTTASKRSLSRKRKFEASENIENGKPAKIPRKAAVKSMKKTRKLLDKTSEVTYDSVEVMDESKENSAKRRYSISKTDTDTHSSDVSWMKPKKSYLFESPKKNYSEWRKSLQKKKELSVKIIPDTNSRTKRNSGKRKKIDVIANSHSDSKSLGLSDLDNYNLTVEKSGKKSTHSVIKALESDFQNISKGTAETNARKKRSLSSSQENVLGSNLDLNCSSTKKLKKTAEVTCKEKLKKSKVMHGVIPVTQDRHTSSFSKANNSGDAERFSNVENGQNKASDNDCEAVEICDNHASINEEITPPTKHDELIQVESEEECENIQSKQVNTSEHLSGNFSANEFISHLEETKGKRLILRCFLESIDKFSEKPKDSTRSSLQETVSMPTSPDPYRPHISSKSFSDGMEFATRDDSSEIQEVDHGNNLSRQSPCEENADNLEELDSGMKNKAKESSFSTKKRKQLSSECEIANQNSSLSYRMSERADSSQPRTSVGVVKESISHQNMRKDKTVNNYESKKIASSSKKNEQRKISKKHKHHKKSKDFKNSSYSSVFSQLTSASVTDVIKDKKWFDAITSLLSKNASELSRKLLATVQICFLEFSNKMFTLRENLIKTAELLEIPPSQNTCEYKLINLMKNCKKIRLEVEKSLRRMYRTGKEYFDAEEKFYRRLKRKQIKANRMFIANMEKVEQNAATKLEEKVLLKTKYFMKILLRHIESV